MSIVSHLKEKSFDAQDLCLLKEKSTFLNALDERYKLTIAARRELGIIARIALIFSRRGLDIACFKLEEETPSVQARISLEFYGNLQQMRAVVSDIRKLIDVESVDSQISVRPLSTAAEGPSLYSRSPFISLEQP